MFPPTFVDVGHLTSPVREDGTHEYVLIDSTQSWANRLEEVADDPALGLPRIEVQVGAQSLSACTLPTMNANTAANRLRGIPSVKAWIPLRREHFMRPSSLRSNPEVVLDKQCALEWVWAPRPAGRAAGCGSGIALLLHKENKPAGGHQAAC